MTTPTRNDATGEMCDAAIKARAFTAYRQGDLSTAEQLYTGLIHTTPSDPEPLFYLGLLCHQTGRTPESVPWLQKALALAPQSLPTLQLLVRIYDETGNAKQALGVLDRYLALRPDDAMMLNIKGQQLFRLGRLPNAEQAFQLAAEHSTNTGMFHDLGLCRQLQGNLGGAADAYRKALQLGDNNPKTHLWLAQCLRAMGQTDEYYRVVTAASQSIPDDIDLLVEAQSARRYICDWDAFERHLPHMLTALSKIQQTPCEQDIPPGTLNYLGVSEDLIAAFAKRYAAQLSSTGEKLTHVQHIPRKRETGDKIHLGYLSTDFFTHAVGSLVRDLFACHDRSRFEVFGYSLRHQPDAIQRHIEQGCDHYHNLSGRGAEDIVRRISEDGIDILIDLAGYTSAAQPAILAARPAPVQISWLGYLGTSGGNFIDYMIADDIVLPEASASLYSEHIIRLPCFLVTSPLSMADLHPSREAAGLGNKGFIFCSFNQPYKLDRQTFKAWMEILHRVPDSKLWLFTPDTDACTTNLRQEAARMNVDPTRLIFAQREPMDNHIARLQLADLALDPFHISGGATSVATLTAGIPTLTLRGESFLARMGSSINTHLGMNDLDCTTPEDYIEKAVVLATQPAQLAKVKQTLKGAKKTSPLFDTKDFVDTLEEALHVIWERHSANLPPTDISIPWQ